MEDIRKDAEYLQMTEEAFIKQYLCQDSATGIFKTVHTPCDFLQENGNCLLGIANRKTVSNIHILISRNGYTVCLLYWRQWRYVR